MAFKLEKSGFWPTTGTGQAKYTGAKAAMINGRFTGFPVFIYAVK
jgi:hypothetical protein